MRNGTLALAAMLGVSLTACDAHQDPLDTSMKIGHVVCTDGKVMPYADAVALDKEPIAVVFYINHNEAVEGHGYAVYLRDTSNEAFTDSIGIAQGTSASLTDLDGNLNTHAMYTNTGCGSPIATTVFDMWRYGQSAYIPSVAQMQLLYESKVAINPIIELCGGDNLPDEASESWYWTSTEVDGQQTVKAWLYSLSSGTIQETPKTQAHKVRPIITIND